MAWPRSSGACAATSPPRRRARSSTCCSRTTPRWVRPRAPCWWPSTCSPKATFAVSSRQNDSRVGSSSMIREVTPRSRLVSRFVASLALSFLGACASASGGSDDMGGDDDDAPDAAVIETPDAAPGTPDAAPDAAPGTPDAHPQPLPDAANTTPDAMTGVPCESGAVCTAAMTLPAVSGDTGLQKQNAQGYQSAWYSIRVTEDDAGLGPVYMSAEVKLTSPIGTDFDLFVYLNVDSDVTQECSMIAGTKTVTGNVESVKAKWGETGGIFSN